MTARVLGVVLVLATVALAGESQPSTPSAGKRESGQPASTQQQPTTDARGTEASPVIVKVVPTPKTQEQTTDEEADREQQSSTNRWTIRLTVILALIGFGQLCVYALQARRLRETVVKMDEIARSQTQDIRDSIHEATRAAAAMERMAEAAKETADAAFASAMLTDALLATNREIERAYVTMSHAPPGLYGAALIERATPGAATTRDISVSVKIANRGNTPATVTATSLTFWISNEPLPDTPPYADNAKPIRVSLVRDSSFHIFENLSMDTSGIEDISTSSTLKLYVFGYVDYLDKFGRRHRAGYARVYSPSADRESSYVEGRSIFGRRKFADRNNLPFITTPGYNYDRERKNGEGNDWDDLSQ
ncbi:MAG: hypothetical protein IMZ62_10720 [Chloroflexi bacterium]|nr:hypothetical protein [Chloroflexota bacterium]